MKGLIMSKLEVERHQSKHGFLVPQVVVEEKSVPKPRMNKTETEFAMMLEAQKRRGEILEWRYEGITLAWGCDPATGKPMRYKGDFVVFDAWMEGPGLPTVSLRIVEIKGPHIYPQDLIRFKGCRSDWPMFRFELHQKTKEGWSKIL